MASSTEADYQIWLRTDRRYRLLRNGYCALFVLAFLAVGACGVLLALR